MAYDRFDPRSNRTDPARYGRDRWSDDDSSRDRGRFQGSRPGSQDERGFFERAGDEIASWFGDEDRDQDRRPSRDFRDRFSSDYREPSRGQYATSDRSIRRDRSSGQFDGYDNRDNFFGAPRDIDPHYRSWRQRHLDELDRDYDQYRQENQSRFENEFGSWRQQRMQKRSLLGQIREQMEVVGNDDEHVGTVDRIAGDRIILTKSDPESGGTHHSLMCSSIDRIEGDRVILDSSAEQAKAMWRDESRSRALFEREDQGEAGPRMLNRSFEGTYR